jgi:hypothetical protein
MGTNIILYIGDIAGMSLTKKKPVEKRIFTFTGIL